MNPFAPALAVANAVLYEGYLLYPYTASSRKNRVRWQFGVIVPREYAQMGTGEPDAAQTEIFVEGGAGGQLEVLVRFLQVEARQVEAWNGASFEPRDSLEVGGRPYLTFDEGIEREIYVRVPLQSGARTDVPIAVPDDQAIEVLRDGDTLVGRIVRRRWALHGAIRVECEPVLAEAQLRKLRVRVANTSAVVAGPRSSALRTAFVSSHTLLHAAGARFLSTLDPPAQYALAGVELVNRHTWPVLVGDESVDSQRSPLVLSSPIILYDFPAVAPQSGGETCDATEIDELMMLSVRSLSDREREEARATDPRARAIVERAERFDERELARLHGTLATLDVPAIDCVFVGGRKVCKGSKVRLQPRRRADVWDLVLTGRIATVCAIHQDVENLMYVAVTVDDDPASDLHEWYGRSFFFYPDEVEPVAEPAGS